MCVYHRNESGILSHVVCVRRWGCGWCPVAFGLEWVGL